MDYEKELKAIRAAANALALASRRLGWSVARTIPSAISRTVQAKIDGMKAESEPFRRLPSTEHARVWAEIEREETAARQLSAGAARHAVEPHVRALDARLRGYLDARKRDTSLSFDGALDGVTADGMIALGTYELLLAPQIESASAADLLRRFPVALESKSARGMVEARLIEQRLERGAGLAKSEADVPLVKELAELVNDFQNLRVQPLAELESIAEVVTAASKAVSRADVAQIKPADPERHAAAKAAFENEQDEYAAAVAAAEAAAARAAGQ